MVALVNSFGRKINDIGGGSVAAPTALPNTDQSRNYNLDGTGNWKNSTFTPVGGSQTTDQRSNNQLNQITQRTVGTGSLVKFQYDGQATPATGNGNLTNDGTLIYQYDALNRLIQVNRASDGLAIATYVYDAGNRRVRKTVTNGGVTGNIPNGTTDYVWQGWQTMEERNPFGGSGSTDTPTKQFIWGTYIDECIQLMLLVLIGPEELPDGPYYPLQDLLYRTVALTDFSGAVAEAYDTEAYGNTLIFTGPGADGIWFTDDDVQSNYEANSIIYCGYRYDAETENYYVRNRYYSPTLGRWITRDPIGYEGGINLYGYVESSPAGEVDLSGLGGPTAAIPPGYLRNGNPPVPPAPPRKNYSGVCGVSKFDTGWEHAIIEGTVGGGITGAAAAASATTPADLPGIVVGSIAGAGIGLVGGLIGYPIWTGIEHFVDR